ncbi:IgGFc-binding protein-like [Mugil cephalus]|uniref:IgGFc-binding protein-like n=1 Tax=Mugil cephalus TaxID=48193 RepID=UPI001FB72D1D|nr:IgGFc-binding protein-like [Mugil cephalus]
MELLFIIFSALLLSGFASGGPTPRAPGHGLCAVMGNLHITFDNHYYTFLGNCSYTLAKNCHVDASHPAFKVDIKNMNQEGIQVPMVESVTVNVYGIHIHMARLEFGVVQVNYQRWNLPITLNDGKLKLFQQGLLVVMETDFGLAVKYDWKRYTAVTVPDSLAGSMCGLCGNFNSKKEDDLITASDSVASSVTELAQSWNVPCANEGYCRDVCDAKCEKCVLPEVKTLENQIFCRTLFIDLAAYVGCQPDVDPDVFHSNCMLDICNGEPIYTYLCSTLQGYSDICQGTGTKVPDWRSPTRCSKPKCPEHSHYEHCASACPATCSNPNAPSNCNSPCTETCVCDEGFVLSGTKCVPKNQCGCTYEGLYVEAGTSFWGGQSCTKRYTCAAGGQLSFKQSKCPVGEECQVQKGIQNCYPLDQATCMVSGSPHIVSFDGQHFDFRGTCTYEMAAVSSSQRNLESFSVVMQNSGKDQKTGSIVQLVEVKVYGYTFIINKEYFGAVVVNGVLSNLPVTLDNNKIQLYRSGQFAVIKTDFGLKVSYDWSSIASVTVPSRYKGAMRGLCGNYNLNPKDDMQMKNGRQASTPEELGQSWKVASSPGCVDGCSSQCPSCDPTQRALYTGNNYCGLISDPAGPFRDCHSKVDPASFLNDCLSDVCAHRGSGNMQCKTLTAYTTACQLKGVTVYSWRSSQFCNAECPSNSHYELCTNTRLRSCEKPSAQCGIKCTEGCICNDGYLQSGNECVPASQCGCMYEGKYYQQGQVFYSDDLCQKECTCTSNGAVQCKQSACEIYERCEVVNYVRSCQPLGKGVCTISGDPHYNTFDNGTYNFQGTCTYVAAQGCSLAGTKLNNFSVIVQNEKWNGMIENPQASVAKVVVVEVHGLILVLRRNLVGTVWINGILHHLPQSLLKGAVNIYQEGRNDVIMTDFGLRVTYDLVYHVTVTVPGRYRGKTCGLCGNFNDNDADEFHLPDGSLTKDYHKFGASWKMSVPGVDCDDGCNNGDCPKCDDSKKAAIEKKCAIITDANGPFAACHGVKRPDFYFNNCVYDVCMAKEEEGMLCNSIATYMLDCQESGVKIQNWRSSSFCPHACGKNSHYDTCVESCSSSCPGLRDIVNCTTACFEGCACDKDFYFNGTGCVPFDQCSCYYNGHTYKMGESLITDDCSKIHTCQASGVVLTSNMACDPNESCQIKNGVMACYAQRCLLGSSGTLTAFNGNGGTVSVPGSYELTRNCIQSQTSGWFRVVVKLDKCTSGLNTIMAVYVFFSDMMVTINYKHEVWINGIPMYQNTFTRNNVKVALADNTVKINNPSSLQLSFSPTNELTMSVSDEVADALCGACGRLTPVAPTSRSPEQMLLEYLRGTTTTFAVLNMGQWMAPDFPQCG